MEYTIYVHVFIGVILVSFFCGFMMVEIEKILKWYNVPILIIILMFLVILWPIAIPFLIGLAFS